MGVNIFLIQMLHGTGIFTQPFPLVHVAIFHLLHVNNPYMEHLGLNYQMGFQYSSNTGILAHLLRMVSWNLNTLRFGGNWTPQSPTNNWIPRDIIQIIRDSSEYGTSICN